MCESAAFSLTDDGEKELMEYVANLKVNEDRITLTNLLGESKTINGRIEEIKFMEHKVLIRETK